MAWDLAQRHGPSSRPIATIGDMPNHVLMFGHSGLPIAMGNAGPHVCRAARLTTTTTNDDNFARATEHFALPHTALGPSHRHDDEEAP